MQSWDEGRCMSARRRKQGKKLIVIGDSGFAEIAYEYFTADSEFEVVGFSVEAAYLKREGLFGKPVVPFETLERSFDPHKHHVFVAVVYTQLNRLRTRLLQAAKAKGFRPASYISPRAFVWRNVELGEHCFVFENNVLQPFVKVGNNVILWSGNHIGHHSTIRDHCFVSSHVVVSGNCDIGENSFLGVNCTISNNVKIGKDCWVGPGVVILKDTAEGRLFFASRSQPAETGALEFFKVPGSKSS